MRTIYLIRHGEPDVPGGEKICLSGTDLPLSEKGRRQGEALGRYFANRASMPVYSSDLLRTRETAACISAEATPVPGLREIGVGEWEGLPFSTIRRQFPEEFALRGEDPVRHGIPGGESPADCRDRALAALNDLREQTDEDFIVVAHAGVNRLILCTLLGRPLNEFLSIPQPYGCINLLREDGDGLRVQEIGLYPEAMDGED